MSKEKQKAGTEDEGDRLTSPWLWIKEELCQLCPVLTQVFHVSLCHRYSHMGQPMLVAFPNQAAPGLTANHSMEKSRIITSFGALLPLARCLSFSCIFQLILMTTMPQTSEASKWHRAQEWRKLWLSFQPWMLPEPPKALNKRQSTTGTVSYFRYRWLTALALPQPTALSTCSEIKLRYFGSWCIFHKFVSLVGSIRNTCAKCWSNVGPVYPELWILVPQGCGAKEFPWVFLHPGDWMQGEQLSTSFPSNQWHWHSNGSWNGSSNGSWKHTQFSGSHSRLYSLTVPSPHILPILHHGISDFWNSSAVKKKSKLY